MLWLGSEWNHENMFLRMVHENVPDVRDPTLAQEELQHSGYFAALKNIPCQQHVQWDTIKNRVYFCGSTFA